MLINLNSLYTDLKIKLNITQEIKDTLEIPRDPELLKTLAIVIPVLIDILKNGNPVFKKHPPESPNLEQVPTIPRNRVPMH